MLRKIKSLPHVELIRNPGFFTAIPATLKDFTEGRPERSERHKHQSKQTFCQLDSQKEIHNRLRALHLILDSSELPESELTRFDAENQKIIKQNYKNIWKLDEGDYFAAARGVLIL
jgi:hypothetical protein